MKYLIFSLKKNFLFDNILIYIKKKKSFYYFTHLEKQFFGHQISQNWIPLIS